MTPSTTFPNAINWSDTAMWTPNGAIVTTKSDMRGWTRTGTIKATISKTANVQQSTEWVTANRRYLAASDFGSLALRRIRSRLPVFPSMQPQPPLSVCRTSVKTGCYRWPGIELYFFILWYYIKSNIFSLQDADSFYASTSPNLSESSVVEDSIEVSRLWSHKASGLLQCAEKGTGNGTQLHQQQKAELVILDEDGEHSGDVQPQRNQDGRRVDTASVLPLLDFIVSRHSDGGEFRLKPEFVLLVKDAQHRREVSRGYFSNSAMLRSLKIVILLFLLKLIHNTTSVTTSHTVDTASIPLLLDFVVFRRSGGC